MAWLYVPGLVDWNSVSESLSETTTALWCTLSGTPTQRPLSWRGWKTRPWSQRLSGTISRPSMAQRGVDAWISSLRASRASRGATPDPDSEPTTNDGSGPQSRGSFATWTPEPSSWRTSQASFLEDLNTFSGPWPSSGSMRSGACSERPTLARPIDGSDSGFWPTPDASVANDGEGVSTWSKRRDIQRGLGRNGNGMGMPLSIAAQMWPTPRAEDAESAGNHPGAQDSLTVPVRLWPTATAMDANSAGNRHNAPTAHDGSGHRSQPTCAHGQECRRVLNPRFVEWLMGWPRHWTCVCPNSSDGDD